MATKKNKPAEQPKADETKPVEEVQETEQPKADEIKEAGFKVAKGKSLTTLGNVKVAGDKILKKDFKDGEKTIQDLIKKGYIVKV